MVKSSTLLYRGEEFRRLVESMRSLIERQAARLLAKGRSLPGVRLREYIDLQSSPVVREALERLMSGRRWRYVSFRDFRDTLERMAKKVFVDLGIVASASSKKTMKTTADVDAAGNGTDVCFVVDSLRKSSFWVVAVSLLAVPPTSSAWSRMSLAVDDDGSAGGLISAFSALFERQTKGRATRLVMMDDATYSGDQLSYFHDIVVDAWKEAGGDPRPRIDVAVPFMSAPSIPLFKRERRRGGLTHLTYEESFSSLFFRRTLSSVLASDVYLMRESSFVTEYHSLFFDFLGVLPTNTLIIFEHKVADSLSIPNRWLQLGPCLRRPSSLDAAHSSTPPAYRINPEVAEELATLLRKDLRNRRVGSSWGGINENGPGTPAQRTMLAASRRICELMQVRSFRAKYALTASLVQDRPSPPAYFPLIPVEFCDPRYRRFVMSRLRRLTSSSAASSITVADEMPPCRRPPYKRSSFRRRLNRTFTP